MKPSNISILGCGWLGLPLGEYLLSKNFVVKGSSTNADKVQKLNEKGIRGFQIHLSPQIVNKDVDNFFDTDCLIVNIPPKLSIQGDKYLLQLEEILKYVDNSSIRYLIYTSSTSVYDDLNREMYEEDVEQASSSILLEAESMMSRFCKNKGIHFNILRCAGLMGYDRFPAKYFSGKVVKNGDTPVNYIHRDDLIRIIEYLLKYELWDEIFNISAPIHPKRKEVYLKNCQEFNLANPIFINQEEQKFKIINTDKWQKRSEYRYIFENPLDFYYEIQ